MKKVFITLMIFALSPTVSAKTIFHCATASGKQIALDYNDSRDVVTYTFGKNLNKPEINLQRTTSQVDVEHFRYLDSVKLNNGAYSYDIYAGYSADAPHKEFAGVTVFKDSKVLVEIPCKGKVLNHLSELF